MIVYDLSCDEGHRFEGWFGSSGDYTAQRARGFVSCPQCGSLAVDKAPMAPAVGRKGNRVSAPVPEPGKQALARGPMPPEVADALAKLADAQARALKGSKWVGDAFAEQSRAMHYGERDPETIHGQATPDEARELFDEGIPVSPLPFPVAPPDDLN
ncbi:MAG TPA: DUF1178 family protein [Croceibacterium sp.]|nr:DUF1178 family protein [Croceibacterium sp.]